ncbi:MAG: AMP-binding protein [Burkholderiales bacterium]|nr:AMP-binding protein [Burkholderiales bacterium]
MTVALYDGQRDWSGTELEQATHATAGDLARAGTRVLATLMDNAAAFVVLDEAARRIGAVHVPLAPFFTPAQTLHAVQAAGVDTLLVDAPFAAHRPELAWSRGEVAGRALMRARLAPRPVPLPEGTEKITFTSGSTGTPKGVCLGGAAMQRVADGLVEALAPLGIERHLNALPFAVLLENIAGVMAPRQRGATLVTLPLAQVGLVGSSQFDAARFDAAVRAHAPHSLILLPQMLRAWCAHLAHSGQRAPAALKLVAVGGAAVGARLIAAAQHLGIPACEGYGLSEGASVQTLNLPGAERPGSAGRLLPHARLRVAADGELEIGGALFSGYLGDEGAPAPADWWPTGDLGQFDADGFVHVRGRKKNLLITAFGRNVSPEWVETELRSQPAVLQAVVFGEGCPALAAVLWPTGAAVDDAALQAAVDSANAALPDYARVQRWARARAAFDAASGLATANGRPQRAAIARLHADAVAPVSALSPLSPLSPISDSLTESPHPMTFHTRLLNETEAERRQLLATPIIQGALAGRVSRPSYIAFLREAYHHVRHTVPLLQAAQAALPAHHAWLRAPLDEYIEEESGHDEWILDDIAACAGDAEAVRHGRAGHATEVMIAYAYDTIARGNPLGFFGMVHVLEGTSVSLALLAADAIQKPLALPDRAFTYLRSHGTLDIEHTAHFARLMDRVHDPADQQAIVHAAKAFFRLYREVFLGLPLPETTAAHVAHVAQAGHASPAEVAA